MANTLQNPVYYLRVEQCWVYATSWSVRVHGRLGVGDGLNADHIP